MILPITPKTNGILKYLAMASENQSLDNVRQNQRRCMETLQPLHETVKVKPEMETLEYCSSHWIINRGNCSYGVSKRESLYELHPEELKEQ